MSRRLPDDPSIKVTLNMPASVYQRLREHAERTGSSMSRLCRDGALALLDEAQSPRAS